MQTYRFLGTEASIPAATPANLNRFGQSFQLPDEFLAPVLGSSVLMLPEQEFNEFGWTEADLAKHFSIPMLQEVGTPEIKARWQATWNKAAEFRDSILNPTHKDGEI